MNRSLYNVEHKQRFANIQIAFDFLSVLKLWEHSKLRAMKNEHGYGIMLDRTFVLKVITDERKKLTHHEMIDCIAEQTALVIIQVSKELKLMIYSILRRPRFSFTHSVKFTYKCFVRLLRKIRDHSKLLKLQQNIKLCHKFT